MGFVPYSSRNESISVINKKKTYLFDVYLQRSKTLLLTMPLQKGDQLSALLCYISLLRLFICNCVILQRTHSDSDSDKLQLIGIKVSTYLRNGTLGLVNKIKLL